MQKRVIKINLMALILIILLIISAIICGAIYIPKLVNKFKQNDQQQSNNNQIDENEEKKISVHTPNGDIEFVAQNYKSQMGYTIKYDADRFTLENADSNLDCFVSSKYKNVGIYINKKTGDYDKITSEIYHQNYNMYYEPASTNDLFEYRVTDETLNENSSRIIKKHLKTVKNIEQEYYIKGKDNEYYVIRLICPTELENELFFIMEEVIKSFKVL